MYVCIYAYVDIYIYIHMYIRATKILMAFLKTVCVERFVIPFGASSQIFVPNWESDSMPYKTGQKKMGLFLVLYAVMLFSLEQLRR